MRVLVLDDVLLELRERTFGVGRREDVARVFVEELVDYLGEELVGDKDGVFVVGDDDAADAFGAAVGVEGVC